MITLSSWYSDAAIRGRGDFRPSMSSSVSWRMIRRRSARGEPQEPCEPLLSTAGVPRLPGAIPCASSSGRVHCRCPWISRQLLQVPCPRWDRPKCAGTVRSWTAFHGSGMDIANRDSIGHKFADTALCGHCNHRAAGKFTARRWPISVFITTETLTIRARQRSVRAHGAETRQAGGIILRDRRLPWRHTARRGCISRPCQRWRVRCRGKRQLVRA